MIRIIKMKLRMNPNKLMNTMSIFKSRYSVKFPIVLLNLAFISLLAITPVFAGNILENGALLVQDVYVKLLGASSAAAGVGVGTGAFMKKFSLGKQDKIELGGKVIKDSIWGWAILNGLTTIIGAGGLLSNYLH